MSIATYSDLVSAVGDWLDRDDLDTAVPTFIQLAEAKLNRKLRDPEMEVRSTTIASGDATTLPADYGSMVSISTGDGRLDPVGPVEFASYRATSGTPRKYVIVDGSISFAPGNATASVNMVYRRRVPALTDANPTNWLLTLAPDVYLYGALMHAKGFLDEDDLANAKALFDEGIDELKQDGEDRKWGAGGLAPRIRRA